MGAGAGPQHGYEGDPGNRVGIDDVVHRIGVILFLLLYRCCALRAFVLREEEFRYYGGGNVDGEPVDALRFEAGNAMHARVE